MWLPTSKRCPNDPTSMRRTPRSSGPQKLNSHEKTNPATRAACHGRVARRCGRNRLRAPGEGCDATNPLDRKFMDDAAGAMNRREVAQKQYDEELAAYQNYLNSWRGSVARLFSSQARSDAKAST